MNHLGRSSVSPGMSNRIKHRASLAAALAAGGLALAACGGSGSTAKVSSGSSGGGAGAYGAAPSTSTTTAVHSGPMGKYLTDAKGRSVYIFSADTSTMSTCHGACAQVWPAVMSGGKQLVFDGHPLYYFAKDTAAGETNGEGITNFGGTWTLVRPDGSALMAPAPKASPSSSGGSTQGWG